MMMTNLEKVILLMLCEMHRHLGIQGEFNALRVQEYISKDLSWMIDRYINRTLSKKNVIENNYEELYSILQAWIVVEREINRLEEEAGQIVIAREDPRYSRRYTGFNPITETSFFEDAAFLINSAYPEEFCTLANREDSSDAMRIYYYRRILSRFREIAGEKPFYKVQLDIEQLMYILRH